MYKEGGWCNWKQHRKSYKPYDIRKNEQQTNGMVS